MCIFKHRLISAYVPVCHLQPVRSEFLRSISHLQLWQATYLGWRVFLDGVVFDVEEALGLVISMRSSSATSCRPLRSIITFSSVRWSRSGSAWKIACVRASGMTSCRYENKGKDIKELQSVETKVKRVVVNIECLCCCCLVAA